ncbi:MAG: hypothetical protein KGK01_02595 [Bradyrhizobium sp.]|uniref:hypothetical protein n=1 Tax=Bradyrhizobium sp. TaxID=376 RepID=UPI0023892478|nr:hypothetical protein [Bradyrhizobium sp.]MDE2065794.1 hypothetical protein [Bradyrhizobium sp.]MDE2241352.1 hypothetical protein [Bradyrhizobium sp.]
MPYPIHRLPTIGDLQEIENQPSQHVPSFSILSWRLKPGEHRADTEISIQAKRHRVEEVAQSAAHQTRPLVPPARIPKSTIDDGNRLAPSYQFRGRLLVNQPLTKSIDPWPILEARLVGPAANTAGVSRFESDPTPLLHWEDDVT